VDGSVETFSQNGKFPASVETIMRNIKTRKTLIETHELKPWAKEGVLNEDWLPKEHGRWFQFPK
jgi:hypothetical protein